MKDWHGRSLEEIYAYYKVEPKKGLGQKESEKRLMQFGHNRLQKAKKLSAVNLFLTQFTDLMIVVLLFAAGISAFLGEKADAITILVIVLLHGILGFVQEYKAE